MLGTVPAAVKSAPWVRLQPDMVVALCPDESGPAEDNVRMNADLRGLPAGRVIT